VVSGEASGPIRVTMVTAFPAPGVEGRGGVETVARTLAGALVATGAVRLSVVAPGERAGTDRVDGIDVVRVGVPRLLPGVVRYATVLRRRLQRAAVALGPDVTHFQGMAGWALGYRGPHVFTVHGIPEVDARYSSRPLPAVRAAVLGAVERRARRRLDAVVVINPYVEELLGDTLPRRRWPIANPVDRRFFGLPRRPGRSVLFAGRVIPIKNVTGLLTAFALARREVPDLELRIAGALEDAAYALACRESAAGLGVASAVHFLGDLDRDRLAEELSTAACLALASHQESAPLVISEAMAAGVPVVAAGVGGVPHMVDDGTTGRVVAPGDLRALAGAISAVGGDPGRAEAMGRAAAEVAKRRHDPDRVAAATVAAYRGLLEGYQPVEA
jgi:glycosyltransferase involved in cell wall biosynthesis